MNNNYLQLHTYSPFSFLFVFVDTIDHIYERIMKNNGVSIRCVKEYSKAETPFRLIACRVNKKDHEAFCDAIKQVRTAALLLGYDEYDSVCSMMRSCENNYK